jgi:hypothetical protein
LLGLQRSAGNAAVARLVADRRMLQRSPEQDVIDRNTSRAPTTARVMLVESASDHFSFQTVTTKLRAAPGRSGALVHPRRFSTWDTHRNDATS